MVSVSVSLNKNNSGAGELTDKYPVPYLGGPRCDATPLARP